MSRVDDMLMEDQRRRAERARERGESRIREFARELKSGRVQLDKVDVDDVPLSKLREDYRKSAMAAMKREISGYDEDPTEIV